MVPDARTWAEALYNQAGERKTIESRVLALESVAAAMSIREDAKLSLTDRYFNDPGIPQSDKEITLASILDGDHQWAAFTALLVRKKATPSIPAISSRYRAMLDSRDGTERIVLESARPLDTETRDKILDAWSGIGKNSRVLATELVKPELLGGFRLSAGTIRYDASISGRLQRLRAEMARPLARSTSDDGGTA